MLGRVLVSLSATCTLVFWKRIREVCQGLLGRVPRTTKVDTWGPGGLEFESTHVMGCTSELLFYLAWTMASGAAQGL